jgi:magnesium transporter
MPGPREEQANLKTIGRIGGLLAMALNALSGLERMVTWCTVSAKPFGLETARIKAISRDVAHLERLSEALQAKCSFLLDAQLGMVAAGQNASLRALSVATVLFVPPTLVASIFGMNFEAMHWFQEPWGPWVGFALVIAAPATLLAFARWRRWF